MEMNQPVGTTLFDQQDGLVGQAWSRVDGRQKVTGGARYAYEVREGAAPAYGHVVEATIAKGRIRRIDTAEAALSPGVIRIITHENAPQQGRGGHREAAPQLIGPDIAHYGQPVALVVAETFEQARAASFLVRPEYDEARGAFDINAASRRKPADQQSPTDTSVGDFDAGFAQAPVKLDVTYTTPAQTHAMMEPHATLAFWEGGRLTLHTSNQMLNQGQKAVAKTLNLPLENVRVVSKFIGGGFGAKLWVGADAILAAIAARDVGRPVKVALTRQQVFHVTTHRSETVQRIRIGADLDGRIGAISHDALSGNLPSEDVFEGAASQTRTLYAGANRLTKHRLAAIDMPVASSMRAPGEAVGLLALECAMDELAHQLKIDPIELRIRNEPVDDPEKHVPYSTRNLIPCLRAGAERFGWNQRRAEPGQVRDGRWLIGLGMAAGTRQNPLQASTCRVRLDPDGYATVRMAMTDIGTGTYTILTQIAAEMLGLPMEQVRVILGDTALPMASGSGGSFGAASSGSALYDACDKLRARLMQAAGAGSDAMFRDGMIQFGGQSRKLTDLVGAGVEVDGEIKPGDMKTRFSQQSYGAHFAEAGVDADTGEIRLRRMLGVFTAGRILNPKTARSQAIGGMVFGVGAALEENLITDARYGYFVNHDLAEYHVPVNADIVELDAIFLNEIDDKTNPLKSKGVGELGICGAGAAVANAVFNATGVRIRDYPLTLDKVLAGMGESA